MVESGTHGYLLIVVCEAGEQTLTKDITTRIM